MRSSPAEVKDEKRQTTNPRRERDRDTKLNQQGGAERLKRLLRGDGSGVRVYSRTRVKRHVYATSR